MKITSKLSIALALALVLSIVGLSVWAAPSRQGTVPSPPDVSPIEPLIPVTGGTYEVTLLGTCNAKGEVTRIPDPLKVFGNAGEGLNYLTDSAKIVLDGPCDIQICYPYPQEYEDKTGQIYKWDGKAWVLMVSTISGTPKKICVVDNSVKYASYGLIGK